MNGESTGMQNIRFEIVPQPLFRCVDGVHIYTDRGTGVIDWLHPATPRRLLFWEDALPMAPHLDSGHLAGHHLDSIRREGHLLGSHLLDGHVQPAATRVFEVGPFVFGRFQHVVMPVDEIGNMRYLDAPIHVCSINSDPPPAVSLRAIACDEDTGRLTFSFEPSTKLVG